MKISTKLDRKKVKNTVYKLVPSAIVLIIFYLALKIRMIPIKAMQYIQALDPYYISTMSYSIVKHGAVPLVDFIRYFPYTAPTSFGFFSGEFAIPAYLFKFFNFLTNIDFLSWAQVYPALMGALMVVIMYFIGKETANKWVGMASSFFLATSAAVLQRSSAGWFEKEAIAGVLMLATIYFVIRAWKRKSWGAGIFGGIFLAISMTSWGGTQQLFLLLPLTAFIVLLFNEDLQQLICTFTPVLLLGNFLAFALNAGTFHIPSSLFLVSMGVLVLIWVRYLAAKYSWVSKKKLPYLVPVLCVIGFFILLLMPLISPVMSHYTTDLFNKALQSRARSGVAGNTVAENNPMSVTALAAQLGTYRAKGSLSFLAKISEYFSPWTFSLVGLSILGVLLGTMFYRKFKGKEEVKTRTLYLWSFVSTFVVIATLFIIIHDITSQNFGLIFTPYLVIMIGGSLLLALFNAQKTTRIIQMKWYYVLIFLWLLTAIYGSAQRSRIIFLTAQPVALVAGIAFVYILYEIKESSIIHQAGEFLSKQVKKLNLNYAKILVFGVILLLILIPTIRINLVNASNTAKGIGGSPNTAWLESLNFLKQQTPVDSVVLSWWDYGYWFESIGDRAATLDGGNPGHYQGSAENLPMKYYVSDFLADTNYTKWLPWLKARGVNYVVLDYTMIGKYSAVTQIHNRNNSQYTVLQPFQFEKQLTEDSQLYLSYCMKSGQNCVTNSPKIFVPVLVNNKSLSVTGAPIFRDFAGNTAYFNSFCSSSGIRKFSVPENAATIPGCIHFDPYLGMSGVIYVPKESVDSTLVKLYLRDGSEMPEFEKVFDNKYVKMWKINYPN